MINRLNDLTPIGTKVIVRSNNDEPYKIGTFKGHALLNPNDKPIPVVVCDGEMYYVMGIIIEFNDAIQQQLDKLTYKEQWNHLSLNYKRQ